jgi:xanthine dehydrogenase/oxidase
LFPFHFAYTFKTKESYVSTAKAKAIVTTLREAITMTNSEVEVFSDFCQKASKIETSATQNIKGRFEIGTQYHFSMETQTCVVVPIEDGLDVYSATQWMDATQIAIAEALGVPNNTINMNVRRLGGGFGGKISRPAQVACAASIAAHHLNRPVRMILSLEANMNIVGKRYACINDYQVEVDDNGKVQKLMNDYVEDYGSCFNEPAYLTTGFITNCYESEAFEIIAKKAKTNTASNTWCRGPGTVEGIAMIENIMEHIAWKVKKDPVEVRLNNISGDSEMRKLLPEFVNSVGEF